jgi:hypothetical protein
MLASMMNNFIRCHITQVRMRRFVTRTCGMFDVGSDCYTNRMRIRGGASLNPGEVIDARGSGAGRALPRSKARIVASLPL